ncbi:TPR-like protein [Backusella circina FSU 941]|nr:TPR-like protein [Backusella circina FSU 941]
MNTILILFHSLANAYMYQSLNECGETTLQLMKLDNGQYSTPWVVSMIGKAYYNSGDYNTASLLFDYNFVRAPWYCETIPFYTTSLWYLEKKYELNLVAYKMKQNKCHRYEAYIAAGNWTKLVGRANETIDWFKKAVEHDPSRYYGYALLGYEELEKEDYLAAKEYFMSCMVANKRSYLGWFGLAKAFQGLRSYDMAKTLLYEAVRLHPHHPVILSTTAEVLTELQKYDEALQCISKSIKIHPRKECIELQQKIVNLMENAERQDEEEEEEEEED